MGTGAEGQYTAEEGATAAVRAAGAAFTQVSRGGVVNRAGAGDYTLTLTRGIPSSNCRTRSQVVGASSGVIRVVHTSDTAKQILVFNVDGTTAADKDFDVSFDRIV